MATLAFPLPLRASIPAAKHTSMRAELQIGPFFDQQSRMRWCDSAFEDADSMKLNAYIWRCPLGKL